MGSGQLSRKPLAAASAASGDSATFFINGEKVRDLRGQAPKGGWRFGLSGDNFDKDKDARLVFRSVKVTN